MKTIDWKTGVWRRDDGGEAPADVAICGDWAPIRDFSGTMLEEPLAVYGDLLPVLRESDLRVANLECPLVDAGEPVHKSGAVLKGVAGHVRGLTAVPFEVVTLGNNHVFDYGIDAFRQTCELLDRNAVGYAGAGGSLDEALAPLRLAVNGVGLAIVSFSEGEDLTAAGNGRAGVAGWEVDAVIDRIREVRADTDVVIVVCHGGVEYIPFPPPYLAAALRRIAGAGADLVIGHHPHVPQGIEIHRGVPICYSLGNFVFFQPTRLQYRKIGYLVRAAVGRRGLAGIRLVPYEIGPAGLTSLKGERLRRGLKLLEGLSGPLAVEGGVEAAWHGFLKHYGVAGFKNEIATIMERLEEDPPKGAAMFRNRLTTLQHSRHLTDLMSRIMAGSLDEAPEWAVRWVADFLTRTVDEGLPE